MRTFISLIFLVSSLTAQTPAPAPPVASTRDHRELRHGSTVIDPYFWLREKSNPDVVKYLDAENAYTEAMTKDLKPFQDALYQEMLGRIQQTDLSRSHSPRRLPLLLADRGGQAVSHSVPPQGQHAGP